MKLSLAREIYRKTDIKKLPNNFDKKEVFSDIGEIPDNFLLKIRKNINKILKKNIVSESIKISEDLILKINEQINKLLENYLEKIRPLFDIIGENFSEEQIIKSTFFKVISSEYGENIIKYLIPIFEDLKKNSEINFGGILDFNPEFIQEKDCEIFEIYQIIKFFDIKNIEDLSSNGAKDLLINRISNGFMEEDIKELKKAENTFGIQFNLENTNNGLIKFYSKIKNKLDYYDEENSKISIYFEYFNLKNINFYKKENIEKGKNLFIFLLEIKKENIENFQEILEKIEENIGFKIDIHSFKHRNFSSFLINFYNEILNENNEKNDKNNEKNNYLNFFERFPKYTYFLENGEKKEKNWNSQEFFDNENAFFDKFLSKESVQFINLFENNNQDLAEISKNKGFIFFQKEEEIKAEIIKIIELLQKVGVRISMEEINETIGNLAKIKNKKYGNYFTIKDFKYFEDGFFDEKIEGIDYFSKKNNLEREVLLQGNTFYENLKSICEICKTKITISNFKKIEKKYFEKYGEKISEVDFLKNNVLRDVNFIFETYKKSYGKEINEIDLLSVILNSDEKVILQYEVNNKKLEILEIFENEFNFDFKNLFLEKEIEKENGEKIKILQFNEKYTDFLNIIFKKNNDKENLKNFLKTFEGLNVEKIINFLKERGLYLRYEYGKSEGFLIQYAFDKDEYIYLKGNIETLGNYGESFSKVQKKESEEKIKIILDKTGGFLSPILIEKFILEELKEEDLDKYKAEIILEKYGPTEYYSKNLEYLKKYFSGKGKGKEISDLKDIFNSFLPENHGLEKIEKNEREKNIKKVNENQRKLLEKKGEIIEGDLLKRNITLYYRQESLKRRFMDKYEFGIICYAVEKYIEFGLSKLYSDIKIVSRRSGDYPKYVHKIINAEYLDVKNKKFKDACTVFSNTIHFTDGDGFGVQNFSIPIFGNAISLSKSFKRNHGEKNCAKINLLYGKNNSSLIRCIGDENYEKETENGNPTGVILEIWKGLRESEEMELCLPFGK